MGFDTFLNAAVPWILVIVAVGWIWWKFSIPLQHLGEKIKGLFSSGTEKIQEGIPMQKDIIINY